MQSAETGSAGGVHLAVNRVPQPTLAGKLTDRRSPHALWRSWTLTPLLVLGLLAATLAFSATSASALTFSRQLTGTPTGAFESVQGVAADAQGNLYVEANETTVPEFSPLGAYLEPQPLTGSAEPFSGATTPNGEFEALHQIAVSPSTGDLYVSEENVVDQFEPSGALVRQLTGSNTPLASFAFAQGLAVDSVGDLYVADADNKVIEEFGPSGEYLEPQPLTGTNAPFTGSTTPQGEFKEPWSVALDAQGDLYVSDLSAKAVDEFTPAGVLVRQLKEVPATAAIPGEFGAPRSVAVDAQGDIFIADRTKKAVDEFEANGEFAVQLTSVPTTGGAPKPGAFSAPGVVAVDAQGDLYIADSNTEKRAVDEFEAAPPPLELLTAVSANVGVSATLNGTVNPNGAKVESCTFEYGTSAPNEKSVPCTTASGAPIGSGSTPVSVSGDATGLAPNVHYFYQLSAESAHGASTDEEAGQFTSSAVKPGVEPGFASNVTQFAATLNGALDPNNAPAGYHFAYVEAAHYLPGAGECPAGVACAYAEGAVTPKPDLYTPVNETLDTAVPQAIDGLHPSTTYDFALVATSSGGTQVGPNASFTTPGIPAPIPVTGGVSGVSEAAVTLTGSVNPEGWETTYSFAYGTTPAYGQSWPTAPIVLGGLSGAQGVSVYVERLQPSTTYYYTVCASNQSSPTPVCGAPQTFRTSEYPASIIQETPVLPNLLAPSKTTTKPETNAQKLAAALKSCKKEAKKKQAKCEAQAKKRYGSKKAKSKKKK
jgi:hypothetical protein